VYVYPTRRMKLDVTLGEHNPQTCLLAPIEIQPLGERRARLAGARAGPKSRRALQRSQLITSLPPTSRVTS
jgi:hypothetical protein